MPEPSIPADDNAEVVTPPAPDAADTKTVDDASKGGDDNLDDASKSTDDKTADDDKTPTDDKKTDDTPATPLKLDDDLDDWITKRGLKVPETDAEKQSLQELRNEQREFTKTRQADKAAKAAKELGDEIHKNKPADDSDDDDLDPLEKRQKKLEEDFEADKTTRAQGDFYRDNGLTADSPEHKAILDIFRENTTKGDTIEEKKADLEYWSNPKRLPLLLELAKARVSGSTDTNAIADKAAREERERIARESESKSPGRAATTTTTSSDKSEDEARTERFKSRFNK